MDYGFIFILVIMFFFNLLFGDRDESFLKILAGLFIIGLVCTIYDWIKSAPTFVKILLLVLPMAIIVIIFIRKLVKTR